MICVSAARVIDVIEHSVNIREYRFSFDKRRKFKPGDYVQLTLGEVTASDIWPDSRTFSIASYSEDFICIIVKKVGYYTSRIFEELNVGSVCTIKYPFKGMFNRSSEDDRHVMIAGGVGITPFFSFIDYFSSVNKLGNLSLLYSVKRFNDLLYYDELCNKLGNRLKVFVTQENVVNCINSRIKAGDVEKLVDTNTHVYLCGSKAFCDDFKELLLRFGVTKIYMDEWE